MLAQADAAAQRAAALTQRLLDDQSVGTFYVTGGGSQLPLVARVLRETLNYVVRDMTNPGGGLAFIEPNFLNPYCAFIFGTRVGRRFAKLEPDEMAFTPGQLRRAQRELALHQAAEQLRRLDVREEAGIDRREPELFHRPQQLDRGLQCRQLAVRVQDGKLRVVLTERRALLERARAEGLDTVISRIQQGAIGELKYREEDKIPKLASEYFARNCWLGASFPSPAEVRVLDTIALDRFMWGSDYPHKEGTYPYTRESLRRSFSSMPEADLRKVFAENIAPVYDFDLEKLASIAARVGPTPEEIAVPLDQIPADSVSPAFTR